MPKLKRIVFIIPLLFLLSLIQAQAPYVVYSASKGVVLKSSQNGTIISPVRGTEVYEEDSFLLADERYFIKIKDTKNREIYEFSGAATIATRDIVKVQKYRWWNNFRAIAKEVGKDFGFDASPVYTSQCVRHKGDEESPYLKQLSNSVALQIEGAIAAGNYETKKIKLRRVYADDSIYSYEVQSLQDVDCAFVIFTIGKDGEVSRHNLILRKRKDGRIIHDEIEFFHIVKNTSLNLNFFSIIDTEDDHQTGYIIVFNSADLYHITDDEYRSLVDWNIIEKKLIYQGNIDRIIVIK